MAAVEIEIRPMQARDVAISEQISDEAFLELDRRTIPRDWPEPERRTQEHSATWVSRTRRFLQHDAGGCWFAEADSGVVGFATSFVRERTWCLATYAETARPLVAETATGRGLAYTDGARLAVLAATDEATARTLLWACLAGAGADYLVPHVTAANQWAVDVGLTAGLALSQSGYLGVRGMPPPSPYVHNGALL